MSKFTNIPAVVVKSGQAWLALLDSGNYSKAWEDAAATMHSCISRVDFDSDMQSDWAPWGKLEVREIKSGRYLTHLPRLPEGNYWIISYTSTFENKPDVSESLVLALEPDAKWRVVGYMLP